jgi:hypothetical protein
MERGMGVEIGNLVEAIQALSESSFGRPSPFHLSACQACGAPTFQYPCPNCRNWCDFSESADYKAEVKLSCEKSGVGSREAFVRRVEVAGGIGPWYFGEFRRTVGYGNGGAFKVEVDAAIARAASVEWPDAGAVWDEVASGARLPDDGFWSEKHQAFEARALAEFGEGKLARLKGAREPGPWHSWPENCREGRELMLEFARERLQELGLTDSVPQPPGL